MHSLRTLSVRQFKSIISLNHIQKQYLCSAKDANSTHFGFQTVHESEKANKGLRK